ncbi:peptidoglycan D,D-transpeptidase FtsI family protein [Microbacterium gorillae]|uniref:peptidoglycan D,D-transpeptidase FtsI family protein n=1 Tax=Microbacterium gorillae TaxID=1231063 RepID=UPI00058B7693|nr:penicillin-binding transpeptidase domain-containing protein [Microbacterium gorillae]
MTKELKRLSLLVLVMFLALFGSVTVIQGVQTDNLAENPANTRARYDSYEIQRGSIIASGTAIASSVPSNDVYSFNRQYVDAKIWAPVTGYFNAALGASTGIEKELNSTLAGTSGSQFFQRLDQLLSGQSPRGSSVELTLDASVQKAAYEALGDLQGAVVAIEPKTGRILAMVSTPSFDTNQLATHDTNAANAFYDQLVADPNKPLFNRAIGGDLNPPGSTFKLVVAAAALESGDYTASSTLPNPATITLPQSNSVVSNASGTTCGTGKTVTIADALRLSCNVPMAELAMKLGDDAIRATAEKFGFNSTVTTPLESTASVYPRSISDEATTGLSGFGQTDVRATPLQMAMVSAAIANGGALMKPTMIDDILAPDLSPQENPFPSGQKIDDAISPETAKALVQMMVANVSNGVASGARIDGIDVAGKTGTAQNDDNPYSLWFTGFAPASDPKVAVAVVVENGGGEGQTGSGDAIAAPIAKQVMEAVLNK